MLPDQSRQTWRARTLAEKILYVFGTSSLRQVTSLRVPGPKHTMNLTRGAKMDENDDATPPKNEAANDPQTEPKPPHL